MSGTLHRIAELAASLFRSDGETLTLPPDGRRKLEGELAALDEGEELTWAGQSLRTLASNAERSGYTELARTLGAIASSRKTRAPVVAAVSPRIEAAHANYRRFSGAAALRAPRIGERAPADTVRTSTLRPLPRRI
jgi:hypothetical protein